MTLAQNPPPNRLRHPNVMSDAERLALPDPTRPIDEPVTPASHDLRQLFAKNSVMDSFNRQLPIDEVGQPHKTDIDQFIKQQQRQTRSQTQALLPLSWLAKLIKMANKTWWERVMTQHFAMNHPQQTQQLQQLQQLEQRLFVMGQMYHTMLCVFLLCQCKSRKTLNPHITLLDLTYAINAYAKAHATELEFLTHHATLIIEPMHVEMAAAAIGWQISKHPDITKRTTTISANNPLLAS